MSVMASKYKNAAHYFHYFGSEYILNIYAGPQFEMYITTVAQRHFHSTARQEQWDFLSSTVSDLPC
jgi:hypothetical protein